MVATENTRHQISSLLNEKDSLPAKAMESGQEMAGQ
jgi:hypothetical protein